MRTRTNIITLNLTYCPQTTSVIIIIKGNAKKKQKKVEESVFFFGSLRIKKRSFFASAFINFNLAFWQLKKPKKKLEKQKKNKEQKEEYGLNKFKKKNFFFVRNGKLGGNCQTFIGCVQKLQ